jgi:uncharacterized protein YjaG (DUF416 family)
MLNEGEVAAKGAGHAEVTGVNAAKEMGLTPTGVAASRGICPACAEFLRELGIAALTALRPYRGNVMIGEEQSPVRLTTLSPKKQLAFALLIFERMLPSLIAFSNDTGFDESCYLQAKDAAWTALENSAVDQALNEACIRSAPDTEKFSHELTSYALNAALAMSDIVEFTLDGCADHIAYVSTLARDSVHLYLSSLEPSIVSSSEEDGKIAGHPLMQQEQFREEEDIRFLSGLPDHLDGEAVSALRARARAQAPLLPLH